MDRIIAPETAYVDLTYLQAFKLSTAYQAGVVTWVAFWAFYGAGIATDNLMAIGAFGTAYMFAVLVEPLAGLVVLALAKTLSAPNGSGFATRRLHNAA